MKDPSKYLTRVKQHWLEEDVCQGVIEELRKMAELTKHYECPDGYSKSMLL
jgi:hypothetical protein